MRKQIIAGNWKMNGTIASGSILIEAFTSFLGDKNLDCEVVVCPPFTALERAVSLTRDTQVGVGAQNMDYHDAGAFTGEVSPLMLTELGVSYVIIGHSERREYYGETDAMVNEKIKSAFHHNLQPIVCVGESLAQREANETISFIHGQLQCALQDIPADQVEQLIIAYEPIWAIGTGKSADAQTADEICGVVRSTVEKLYGKEVSEAVRIQYGGSVKPETIEGLMAKENIDGALVGGASLEADSFLALLEMYK